MDWFVMHVLALFCFCTTALVVYAQDPNKFSLSVDGSVKLNEQPWEQQLVPAPMAVALLGQLIITANKNGTPDFALKPPINGFKIVSYPESFKATLLQISTGGYNAFENANTNMKSVANNMQYLPTVLREAVKTAKEEEQEVLHEMMQAKMDEINNIAMQCVMWANETAEKFDDVMNLMNEVVVSAQATKGVVENDLAKAKREAMISKAKLVRMEKEEKEVKERVARYDANLKSARENYDKSMNEIPTGWAAIGQEFGRTLVRFMGKLLGAAADQDPSPASNQTVSGSSKKLPLSRAAKELTVCADATEELANNVQKVADEVFTRNESKNDPHKTFVDAQEKLIIFRDQANNVDSDLKRSVKTVLNEVIDVVEKMAKITETPLSGLNMTVAKPLPEDLKTAVGKVRQLIITIDKEGREEPDESGKPAESDGNPKDFSGPDGNARFKAVLAKNVLERAEDRSLAMAMEARKLSEKILEVMTNMTEAQGKTIDFTAIIDLIRRGMETIGEIQKNWQDLVQFFKTIAVDANYFSDKILLPMLKRMQIYLDSDKLTVQKQRDQIAKALTEKAYDVQYVIPHLAGLSGLSAETDPVKQQEKVRKLMDQAKAYGKEITNLALRKRKSFSELVRGEKQKLAAYLPPATKAPLGITHQAVATTTPDPWSPISK